MSTAAIAAPLIGGAVSGAASIFGSNKQADAANQAAALQQQQFEQTQKNQAPFIQAGQGAVGTISSDLQNQTGFATPFNFQADPGYAFTKQQGTNAINNSAAATGGVLNGGTLKALDQYTTGLANTTYGNAYNRYLQGSQNSYNQLAGLAQIGEGATATTGAQGLQAAANQGNDIMGAGNAQAAGAVGLGNAVNQGIGGATNAFNTNQILQQLQGLQSQSSYGSPIKYPDQPDIG